MEIKGKGQTPTAIQATQATPLTSTPNLSGIPQVSLDDVKRCIGRSQKAAHLHEDILKRVADGRGGITKRDLEGMLSRAGVETTDVKTVLAYHAHHHHQVFDKGALDFMRTLDWSDVSAAHVDELKRQNAEQVRDHRTFIETDKREFEQLSADDKRGLQKKNDEKAALQKKTAFEADADFADEITKSGISDPKQATLLALHRKRFTSST